MTMQESTVEQLNDINYKVSEFVTMCESALHDISAKEETSNKIIQDHQRHFEEEIQAIRGTLEEMETIITRAGAARWRTAAESALREGQQHLSALEQTCDVIQNQVVESTTTLQKAAIDASTRISKAADSFKPDEIKKMIKRNTERVDRVTLDAIKRITTVVRWFHWEKFGLAIVIAVIVSLCTGLFINDQMPWETHRKVVEERNAGRVLINAWTHLSAAEQQHIREYRTV